MQSKAQNATIILTAIFPRNDNMAVMPTINKINANLSKFADGRKIRAHVPFSDAPVTMPSKRSPIRFESNSACADLRT